MNAEDVRSEWATRSAEYSPEYYAYRGPNETSELIRETLVRRVGPDAAVLEIGCSSGRHLAHLHDHGFGDLHGVDVNEDAFDVMADAYPDLAAAGTFHRAAMEDVLTGFDGGRFDAVYAVETLQHVHPDDAWVFSDVGRVTDDLLVTVECEAPVDGRTTEGPRAGDRSDEGSDERLRSDRESNGRDRSDGASDSPERPGGSSGGGTRSDEGPTDGDPSDGAVVNYVDDDLPLYYRQWRDIFTGLGMTEVDARSLKRDTFRAFRHA